MTEDDFRHLALALPEAEEAAHMGHADFRVRNKIFATLSGDCESIGMVKLAPEEQALYLKTEPAVYYPASGAWGRRGCTHLRLELADARSAEQALRAAWRNVAPKRLIAASEPT